MADDAADARPDFGKGVSIRDVPDGGSVLGRLGDDEVLLVRTGGELFAVGSHCTHYRGPLAEGLVVGDTVRCPWHHACFNLRTGEPVRAPALDNIQCWRVERRDDTVYVHEKITPEIPRDVRERPESVVIIGGGAAGMAASDMLRRRSYDGPIAMISADESVPVDRPNLSKDFLAGTAQDDWIPIWPAEHYAEQRIDLMLNTRVIGIDTGSGGGTRQVRLSDGSTRPFGALLIATGADPVHLDIPGADSPHVHYLRTFADSRAIIAATRDAKRVAVIGASFIALEVSASLRARNIDIDVIAPDRVPLERVMGAEIGGAIKQIHEAHGVTFHLGETVNRIDGRVLTLSGGSRVEADIIVAGIGVRPAIALAEQAGLAMDRGIAVNEYLETSVPGIYAAGDIARWPDPHTGDRIRVEHWVHAERQGQVAARNILGHRQRYDLVPFFWSQHYDVTINYVGHAEKWDRLHIDGNLEAHDARVTFLRGDRPLAVATIGRDLQSLQSEVELEHIA